MHMTAQLEPATPMNSVNEDCPHVITWTHGLFSCKEDPGTFILSILFAPCQFGFTMHNFNGSDCLLCGMAFVLSSMGGCESCFAGYAREKIREKAGIEVGVWLVMDYNKGSFVEDLVVHCCCLPCALTQEKLEVDVINAHAELLEMH